MWRLLALPPLPKDVLEELVGDRRASLHRVLDGLPVRDVVNGVSPEVRRR